MIKTVAKGMTHDPENTRYVGKAVAICNGKLEHFIVLPENEAALRELLIACDEDSVEEEVDA